MISLFIKSYILTALFVVCGTNGVSREEATVSLGVVSDTIGREVWREMKRDEQCSFARNPLYGDPIV